MQQPPLGINKQMGITGIVMRTLLALLPLFLLAGYAYVVHLMMFPGPGGESLAPAQVMKLQTLATILLLLVMLAVCLAFYICIAKSSLPETIRNISLSVTVIVLILLGAECFFLHYERSNAIGYRWSYRLWDNRYMANRTHFYFTDSKGGEQRVDFREPVPNLKKKKNPVWFIGDSFTYGFGIEQTAQTFPAQVQQQLHEKVTCINLGNGGADTYHEKETLFGFDKATGQKPFAVVWQYFGNDIDSADEGPDLYAKQLVKSKLDLFGKTFFQAKSFLLDYIYWEYFRANESGNYNAYIDFLNRTYLTDSVVVNGKVLKDSDGYITPWSKHLVPLKQSAAYYKNAGTKFLVVIFPYLWKDGVENAEKLYSHRLENELKACNTDVIDLSPLLKDIPADKRIANSHDPHPSPLVDQIVADTIAKYFVAKYGI